MLCCHPPVYSSSDDWICLGLDARINPNPNPRWNPPDWRKRYLSSFQVTLVAYATARRRFCDPSSFLSGDKETYLIRLLSYPSFSLVVVDLCVLLLIRQLIKFWSLPFCFLRVGSRYLSPGTSLSQRRTLEHPRPTRWRLEPPARYLFYSIRFVLLGRWVIVFFFSIIFHIFIDWRAMSCYLFHIWST